MKPSNDNARLDRGRILALVRRSRSHCDVCDRELNPMRDVVEQISEFKIRCARCALRKFDAFVTTEHGRRRQKHG